jgi:hypothetical protein
MSKVKLQVRVQVEAGDRNYPFVSPAFAPNGKINPGVVVIRGKETPIERTLGYYIPYTENRKRRLEPAGTDGGVAQNAMRRKEATLKASHSALQSSKVRSQPPGNVSVSPARPANISPKSRSTSARKPTTPTATRSCRP